MTDPDQPNGFLFWFLFMIFLSFLMLVGVRQSVESPVPVETTPMTDSGGTFESLTVIESVEALVLESYPYQINLAVIGYQPDGCDFPVQVEQSREGNRVKVKIYRDVPLTVLCTMQLVPYRETIRLDGTFESGAYVIEVNDRVIELTL
jgi:hypothetical protein